MSVTHTMNAREQVRQELLRLCYGGLDSRRLRLEVFNRLQRAVPYDVYWCSGVDPETLLFTGAVMKGVVAADIPAFIENELRGADVDSFVELARRKTPVNTLHIATCGDPRQSARYREILEPRGQGPELRAALRSGKSVWGAMCLHRELRAPDFSPEEVAFVSQIAPHVAAGLRIAALLAGDEGAMGIAPASESPGLILLSDDLSILALTPAAECWLSEIADWPGGSVAPQVIYAVATRLQAIERIERIERTPVELAPRARIRTRNGQWLTLHASRLASAAPSDQIAVIIEPARPAEVASLILLAYALTEREAQVAQLVLKGRSTDGISEALSISTLTVQQHLKAIFDKVGVRSRRELVAQIFADHYWPRIAREWESH